MNENFGKWCVFDENAEVIASYSTEADAFRDFIQNPKAVSMNIYYPANEETEEINTESE